MKLKSPGSRGFTLIEMVVVITLILILLSIALPMYNQAIRRSKEARLHHDVALLNELVQRYSIDKNQAPQSLDDLVSAGYMKAIPEDVTGRTDTWAWDQEDPEKAFDPNQPGIAAGTVHSGSKEIATDGRAYSDWTH